ncbi:hypothetical protein KP509_38G025000 [Ceratopteris richardii]|uniref:CBS domain-containing protein n=1 Tax=Ceratopteris richardii TaxID=49495 RepID=A0A8T2Q3X2_CERRI|nr:hypothetical protein KP509_38G025000 [Ceratopteris richardii]
MQKILCHLATQQSLCNPVEALQEPVTALLSDNFLHMTVEHVDPQASHSSRSRVTFVACFKLYKALWKHLLSCLLEVLQLIEAGVQNLVVPIMNHGRRCYSQKGVTNEFSNHLQKSHGGQFFCWLTHEDVLRFLLGSISVFSPVPMTSIEDLGIIRTDICLVKVDEDVVSALESIKAACMEMSAVAVVEDAEVPGAFNLVGDISCTTLQACNEMVALALATLSAGDFLLYVEECWHPTEVAMELIRKKLHEKLGWENIEHDGDVDVNLDKVNLMLQNFEIWEESSSDGEDSGLESPTGPHDLSRKWPYMHRHSSSKFGMSHKHRSGPIFCNPRSSLVAVLLQALAYREHYVWVLRDDGTLLGIVTFSDILTLMFNCVNI